MMDLLLVGLATYAVTHLVVAGHILDTPRFHVIRRTEFLRFGGYHLLECHFCTGFWVAFGISLSAGTPELALPAWGLAHFLRRVERGD